MTREAGDLTGLDESVRALVRTVDALSPDDLRAPSLLPGWSRAHVVGHLALSGVALAGVLDRAGRGEVVAMYASDEQRDAEIERLAAADPADLREQLLASTTTFARAVEEMEPERWETGLFNRLPGGPTWPVVTIPTTRRREVEVHHADLGAAYTRRDWPDDFARDLLAVLSVDQADSGPFLARATDLGQEWRVGGEGGPTVMGTGADLGWWLSGRGTGEGLSAGGGLPRLAPWQRAPALED